MREDGRVGDCGGVGKSGREKCAGWVGDVDCCGGKNEPVVVVCREEPGGFGGAERVGWHARAGVWRAFGVVGKACIVVERS